MNERGRWIYDYAKGQLVDAESYVRTPPKRSNLPAPMLIRDEMPPVQSQLDGKLYDSKAALRATYRRAGVTEIGNDAQRFSPRKKPKPDRKKIVESIEKARAKVERGQFTEDTKRRLA